MALPQDTRIASSVDVASHPPVEPQTAITTDPVISGPIEPAAELPDIAVPPALSGSALACLIFALANIAIPLVMSVPSVIVGLVAIAQISRRPARLRGKWLAVSGLALSVGVDVIYLAAILLVGGAYFAGVGPFGVNGGGPLVVGVPTKATLHPRDMPRGIRRATHQYTVSLEKNKSYIIDMTADLGAPHDPLIVLFDPQGKLVAENDDAMLGPNPLDAQVRFKAAQSGVYTIHATHVLPVAQGGMPYTISVKLDEGAGAKKGG